MLITDDIDNEELKEFYLKLGTKIKQIRKDKGLTQLELAHKMGHSSVALVAKAELVSYNKHLNLEHLYRISKALDL
ncbi:MAG: helix-turn-helix transcriptional regulator, partial [Campylobacterota bacterium]|nr:helix-turn-helix transcriptional regulator [Campylobacterota bacterium]